MGHNMNCVAQTCNFIGVPQGIVNRLLEASSGGRGIYLDELLQSITEELDGDLNSRISREINTHNSIRRQIFVDVLSFVRTCTFDDR